VAVPWHRIEAFSDHFAHCAVTAGETAVVLAEADSRPELVEVATIALERLGALVATVVMPTPPNRGPVPIRSTGASVAVGGHRAAIAGLAAADFIVDCTVEGLLHAVEKEAILADGARVLMLSNEHPEVFDRVGHDPSLGERVARGRARLAAASTMRVTSAAGTDLTVDLATVASMDKDMDRVGLVTGASVYPLVWNILLAARAEGLGGVLTTAVAPAEAEVRSLLGLPETHAVAAMVPLGVPVRQLTRLSRRPVEDFATIDRFDGPPLAGTVDASG